MNIIITILNSARLKPKLLLLHKSYREEQVTEKMEMSMESTSELINFDSLLSSFRLWK